MNIKSLCLAGIMFLLLDVNASEHSRDLSRDSQSSNSATNNLQLNQIQESSYQQIKSLNNDEQVKNSQTIVTTDAQNENNEQQTAIGELTNLIAAYVEQLSEDEYSESEDEYYWGDTERAMYDSMNEEQYGQAYDIYQGLNEYGTAWQYWYPWQCWCQNCAYQFYGIPER